MSQNTESHSGEGGTTKRRSSTEESEGKPAKCFKFDNIQQIFTHFRTIGEFCIGGEIELNEKMSKLFYTAPDGTDHSINFLDVSENDIDTLVKHCSPSPFGMGSQSMTDPNVRHALELRANKFAFQFNIQTKSTVTAEIKKLLGHKDFLIEPYKLNIYPVGGHFKRHKDTLKTKEMIASLVICLPVPFEGGVLSVENVRGLRAEYDWGKQIGLSSNDTKKIHWACFFCSCDHFISKVTKGNRITLAYDIFRDTSEDGTAPVSERNIIPEAYREECTKFIDKFVGELDVTVRYGYFPNHTYSFSDTDLEDDDLRCNLKGNDLVLYDAFIKHGWTVILQVYYPDMESYGHRVEFQTEEEDSVSCMEDALLDSDKESLIKVSTLTLLNELSDCKTEEIHDYEHVHGYTGNSPITSDHFFYAGTIMVVQHRSNEAKLVP